MSTTKFAKYFKKTLLNEEFPPSGPIDDATALKKSIENPKDSVRLDNEIQDVSVGADQANADMEQLRETANGYSQEILGILERVVAIHNDITSGPLAKLGIKVGTNTLTSIRGDLGKLAQIIGGGVNDVISKQETDKAKTQTKTA